MGYSLSTLGPSAPREPGQVDEAVLAGVLAALFQTFDCHNAPDPIRAARVASLLYDDAITATGEVDERKLSALVSLLR